MRIVFTHPMSATAQCYWWSQSDDRVCAYLESTGIYDWWRTDADAPAVYVAYVFRSGYHPEPMYDK